MMSNANVEEKQKKILIHDILLLLIKILISTIVVALLFTYIFGILRNKSPFMHPAIQDGDLILYYRMDKMYVSSDVLIMEHEGKKLPLRVVAVAGDIVDIQEDGLYINGALQIEYKIYELTQRFEEGIDFPLTVEEGEVFVLGDSREHATDSRIFGSVKMKDTCGTVMTIIRRRGI